MAPPEALTEASNEALTAETLTEPPIGALTEASDYNYYIIIIKYFITIIP